MPDMANLLNSPSPPPPPSLPPPLPSDESSFNLLVKAAEVDNFEITLKATNGGVRVLKQSQTGEDKSRLVAGKKILDEHVNDWIQRRINAGVPQHKCFFPFLTHAPKMVECYLCPNSIYPGDEIECSIKGCNLVCHIHCATQKLNLSSLKEFKCPQHACYLCHKKTHLWRCTRCEIASHDKCAAFPEHVIRFHNQPGKVICWRHFTHFTRVHNPINNIEKIFTQLPLPCIEEEFKLDINLKESESVESISEPPSYIHIKRNIYITKKKRDPIASNIGCTSCNGTECKDNCVCRVQSISCSKACNCSEICCNRQFRKEKKIKIVKTESCGWGVESAERINKRDFIVEYVGEVIDDALCEKRLWDMKDKGVTKFYMCEIKKDFTIDATFKGNTSRFLNHSCDPNCNLEKWQVEDETRIGVFANRDIEIGEALTYDYRFVQFGTEVKCYCGAKNCQGYLGNKKKREIVKVCWGVKRRRTSITTTTH